MTDTSLADRCLCCGHEREYVGGRYWYRRRPRWFWRTAIKIVCAVRGCRLNCDHGDCFRCG